MKNIYSKIKLSNTFSTLVNKALEDIDNLNRTFGGHKPPTVFHPNLSENISCKRNHIKPAGFFSALSFIRDNFQTLTLSIDLSHQLHLTIFQDVETDFELRGIFKAKHNHIKHVFSNGQTYLNHCTTPPVNCQYEVQKLFSWVNINLQNKTIHPLILTALFKFQFVSIHPYPEGNGKMSRLLSLLILLKSGYKVFESISLDEAFEPINDEYIKTLIACQFYLPKKIVEIEYWFLFFLSVVSKAYYCHTFNQNQNQNSLIIPAS